MYLTKEEGPGGFRERGAEKGRLFGDMRGIGWGPRLIV